MSQEIFEKAISVGDSELCKRIIDSGKANFTCSNGISVIWLVNLNIFSERDRQVLALLYLHKVNLNSSNSQGQTLLHKVVENNNYKTSSLIIDYDIDINKKDCSFQTALNYAIYNCNLDICRLLIERGADPNSTDEQGWTPIMHLATRNFSQVIVVEEKELDLLENLLIETSNLLQRNYDNHSVLHICKYFHNKRMYNKIKSFQRGELLIYL